MRRKGDAAYEEAIDEIWEKERYSYLLLKELGVISDLNTPYTEIVNLFHDEHKVKEVLAKLKLKAFW